ncbi:MAG: AraC family transcriptional regulator, partial [Burkholderiales bacterium]|nr:AraC family transcriptional regulator [Burkholderiales bacterium]
METDAAAPLSAWHAEHEHFNRLLLELRRELDVFHRGERPDYERICEIVTYLRDYGDVVHHPREDAAF